MSGSTLVCIPECDLEGLYLGDVWAQPWNVETVDRTLIGSTPETAVEGSTVSIGQGDDVAFKIVLSRLTPEMIAARVDAARNANRSEFMSTVQPVRVTNWMAQAWVLILVQFVGNLLLYRWATRLGECLFWHVCLYDGWWLP